MKTKEQVTQEFRTELQALFDRYGADLAAEDNWNGYAECGSDIRMTVYIPGIYDKENNCVREYTEIDLGRYMLQDSKTGE